MTHVIHIMKVIGGYIHKTYCRYFGLTENTATTEFMQLQIRIHWTNVRIYKCVGVINSASNRLHEFCQCCRNSCTCVEKTKILQNYMDGAYKFYRHFCSKKHTCWTYCSIILLYCYSPLYRKLLYTSIDGWCVFCKFKLYEDRMKYSDTNDCLTRLALSIRETYKY